MYSKKVIKVCLDIVKNFMKEDMSPKTEIKEYCNAIKKILQNQSFDKSTYTFMLWDALGVDGIGNAKFGKMLSEIEKIYLSAGKTLFPKLAKI